MDDRTEKFLTYVQKLYTAHMILLQSRLGKFEFDDGAPEVSESDLMKAAWLWFLTVNLDIAESMRKTLDEVGGDVEAYIIPENVAAIMQDSSVQPSNN